VDAPFEDFSWKIPICADLKKGAAADARLQLMTMAAVTADAVVSDSRPDHDST
jgi:hypothetical protein